MLGLSWFRRKPARNIFKFWDGERNRFADPFEVARILDTHAEFRPSVHVAMLMLDGNDPAAPSPAEVADSQRITVAAVREAFGLKSFADGGLTEQEVLSLLSSFMDYMEQVKKKLDN